jgi:hypothetical protein
LDCCFKSRACAQFGKWKYVYVLNFKLHYRLEKVFYYSLTNIYCKICLEISSYLEHDFFLGRGGGVRFVCSTGTNTWKVLYITCPRYVCHRKLNYILFVRCSVIYCTVHPFIFLCFYYLPLVRKMFLVKYIAGSTVIKLCEKGHYFNGHFVLFLFIYFSLQFI